MIRHTEKTEINNKLINNEIFKKHINFIIFMLNKVE